MKICVYAISKNEEKFVKRWYESMKEADEIYVLDTGSTDNTVNELKKLGVNVYQEIISPWRFDTARNKSLDLVPKDTDVCICTDLDEIFVSGWRQEIEKFWTKETTNARYNYNWSLDEFGKPKVNFYIEKMHSRDNFIWTHPVHEVLKYKGTNQHSITIDSITLNHYPDHKKSRSSYLKLLELSVKEDPEDDRNMHYLGREYMFNQLHDKCIKTLKKHLKLKSATWTLERAASMRFIARSYKAKNDFKNAKKWYLKAINEAPNLRDAYVERALLAYEENNYKAIEKYCLKALQIKNHQKVYINETFSWDSTIFDLLSLSYYYQKNYLLSLYFVDIAISMNPNDERLLNNRSFIEQKIKN
ncbi:MAG: glycosyltransferase [Bacilli bacterium]|nr:glycosyltransferase [Bacilli bacterium]